MSFPPDDQFIAAVENGDQDHIRQNAPLFDLNRTIYEWSMNKAGRVISRSKDVETAELLLELGAVIADNIFLPNVASVDVARFMLRKNPRIKIGHWHTHAALRENRTDMFDFLVEQGAPLNHELNLRMCTFIPEYLRRFDVANVSDDTVRDIINNFREEPEYVIEALEGLKSRGIPINFKKMKVTGERLKIDEYLLRNGANVDRDHLGNSLLASFGYGHFPQVEARARVATMFEFYEPLPADLQRMILDFICASAVE